MLEYIVTCSVIVRMGTRATGSQGGNGSGRCVCVCEREKRGGSVPARSLFSICNLIKSRVTWYSNKRLHGSIIPRITLVHNWRPMLFSVYVLKIARFGLKDLTLPRERLTFKRGLTSRRVSPIFRQCKHGG